MKSECNIVAASQPQNMTKQVTGKKPISKARSGEHTPGYERRDKVDQTPEEDKNAYFKVSIYNLS